jgi:hypothetical protein
VQGYSWNKLVVLVVLKIPIQRPTHHREILLLLDVKNNIITKNKRVSAQLKALVQSVQIQSVSYFNPLSSFTNPQITKAQRLHQTFQQVLEDPAAEEALKHPALKPLLEQAAE